MNLAKLSSTGQITVPVEIRRLLKLNEGDKILFIQNKKGEVFIENASIDAVRKAQKAFSSSKGDSAFKNADDAQRFLEEITYGKL